MRKLLRKRATPAEALLWSKLRGRRLDGLKFRRQHSIGKYIVDFYCPKKKLVVELDGKIHESLAAMKYDFKRQNEIELEGIKVIRFTNQQIFDQTKMVLEEISSVVKNLQNS
ncbi:endonuclease domain-containing protein [Flavobacteriales bacterium]|nr:endonuclease domain-containing protein [Flavobacteriales bacterium]